MIVISTLVFRLLLAQLALLSAAGSYVLAVRTAEETAFMNNFESELAQFWSAMNPMMEAINTGLSIIYKYNVRDIDGRTYNLPEELKDNEKNTLYVKGVPQVYSQSNKRYVREFAEDNKRLYEALNYIDNGQGYHKKRDFTYRYNIRDFDKLRILQNSLLHESRIVYQRRGLWNLKGEVRPAIDAVNNAYLDFRNLLYSRDLPGAFNSLLRDWHKQSAPNRGAQRHELIRIVEKEDPDNTFWLKWIKKQLEINARKYKVPKVMKPYNKAQDQGNPNTLQKLEQIYAAELYYLFITALGNGISTEDLNMSRGRKDATGYHQKPKWLRILGSGHVLGDPRIKPVYDAKQSRKNPFPKFPLEVILKEYNPKAPPAVKKYYITDLLRLSLGSGPKKRSQGGFPARGIEETESTNQMDFETKRPEESIGLENVEDNNNPTEKEQSEQ